MFFFFFKEGKVRVSTLLECSGQCMLERVYDAIGLAFSLAFKKAEKHEEAFKLNMV